MYVCVSEKFNNMLPNVIDDFIDILISSAFNGKNLININEKINISTDKVSNFLNSRYGGT